MRSFAGLGGVPLLRLADHCPQRILEDVRVSALEQHQRACAAFQPGRARLPADNLREGFWPERGLDPGAHGVQINPDSGQRVLIQAAEQDRSRSGTTGDLRRDVFDRGTAGVQDGARGRGSRPA